MSEAQAPAEPTAAPVVSKDVPEEKAALESTPESAKEKPPSDDANALVVYEAEKKEAIVAAEKKEALVAAEKKEAIVESVPDKSKDSVPNSSDRDAFLAKVNEEKRIALIKAWQENEVAKAENKYHKSLSNIDSWETTKKSASETKLRKFEEKLEKKKAAYVEKMKNEIATIHKAAEEKKAMVEAKRGEDILKAEEKAAKSRASGPLPKKFLSCFSA
uniref:Remorin C-terminal domain-containing protein n=1 Tax=Araucaria cunninghamii TaxID=56994 RepID=A0A0D6R707_ARACU